jgi:hypothetical protein
MLVHIAFPVYLLRVPAPVKLLDEKFFPLRFILIYIYFFSLVLEGKLNVGIIKLSQNEHSGFFSFLGEHNYNIQPS